MSNIQIMMHLLNFYTNQKLKRMITMEIIDLKDEQGEARGTRVVFRVAVERM